ncbi:MAG: hypothetical protein ACM3U2_00840 [Deltaproteobacteria bacterium]
MSMNSLFDLSGRVAVVSGAVHGMGRAVVLALADAGAISRRQPQIQDMSHGRLMLL